jgi:hypothetical protein
MSKGKAGYPGPRGPPGPPGGPGKIGQIGKGTFTPFTTDKIKPMVDQLVNDKRIIGNVDEDFLKVKIDNYTNFGNNCVTTTQVSDFVKEDDSVKCNGKRCQIKERNANKEYVLNVGKFKLVSTRDQEFLVRNSENVTVLRFDKKGTIYFGNSDENKIMDKDELNCLTTFANNQCMPPPLKTYGIPGLKHIKCIDGDCFVDAYVSGTLDASTPLSNHINSKGAIYNYNNKFYLTSEKEIQITDSRKNVKFKILMDKEKICIGDDEKACLSKDVYNFISGSTDKKLCLGAHGNQVCLEEKHIKAVRGSIPVVLQNVNGKKLSCDKKGSISEKGCKYSTKGNKFTLEAVTI